MGNSVPWFEYLSLEKQRWLSSSLMMLKSQKDSLNFQSALLSKHCTKHVPMIKSPVCCDMGLRCSEQKVFTWLCKHLSLRTFHKSEFIQELHFLFNKQNGQQRQELKSHFIQSNTQFAYYVAIFPLFMIQLGR